MSIGYETGQQCQEAEIGTSNNLLEKQKKKQLFGCLPTTGERLCK